MKKYTEYLAESKRTYQFRIRVADCDLTPEVMSQVERALAAYSLPDISKPKRMPISRTIEFHQLGPVERHQFEVSTHYPAIPPQIRQSIHNATGIPLSYIKVMDPLADDIKHDPEFEQHDGPLLLKPELGSADSDAQDHVGEKRIGNLLKDLANNKHGGEQYKGVNDQLLVSTVPAETAAKTTNDLPQGGNSAVGTVKNKLQPSRTGSKI